MHDDDEDRFLGGPLDYVAKWTLYLISALVLVACISAIWTTFANAHDWYPSRCCWSPQNAPAGRLGDCDQIPDHAVKVGPDGYVVTLEPGEHPMVKERMTFVVPYSEAEKSPDGRAHICISPTLKRRCFFIGHMGS